MRSNEQQLHSGTLASALDTVNGVTESAEVSVEVLLKWKPTGVDISGRSRASSLPIGYSSLPSVAEHLPQVSTDCALRLFVGRPDEWLPQIAYYVVVQPLYAGGCTKLLAAVVRPRLHTVSALTVEW